MITNNSSFDFFGIKRKGKVKSAAFPFMYNPPAKTNRPAVVHFLERAQPIKPMPKSPGAVSYWGKSLYKKESIKQKRFSKWGDADMDGSPNYFDCDPVDWLKDAKKMKKGKTFAISEKNKDYYLRQLEKERASERYRRAPPEQKLKMTREEIESLVGTRGRQRKGRIRELSKRQAYLEGSVQRLKDIEMQKEERRAEREREKESRKAESAETRKQREYEGYVESAKIRLGKKGKTLSKKVEKRYGVTEKLQGIVEERKKPGIFSLTTPAAAELEYVVGEKLKKGKMPTAKELKRYADIQKKKFSYTEKQFAGMKKQKVKEEVLDKYGNPVIDPKTGKPMVVTKVISAPSYKEVTVRQPITAIYHRAVSLKEGTQKMLSKTYGARERIATAKTKRLVAAGLGGLFGETLMKPQVSRGRPRGPSGKYKIEGKPVFEEEYQKFAATQRAMNRITPSIAQEAPVTPEEMQNIVGQPPEEGMEGQPMEQQVEASTSQPMTPEQIEASKQLMAPTRRGPTSEEVLAAQELAQAQDNILNAPSILKGELKATGGSLLTPTGPQIMDAPNAFKGQLRTLNRSGEVPAVRLSERPQTNPYGDEYIDIELGSGKPVLKRRPREKWMTGEAL